MGHCGCGEPSTGDLEGSRASSWAISILILQTRWGLTEDLHALGAADAQCVLKLLLVEVLGVLGGLQWTGK